MKISQVVESVLVVIGGITVAGVIADAFRVDPEIFRLAGFGLWMAYLFVRAVHMPISLAFVSVLPVVSFAYYSGASLRNGPPRNLWLVFVSIAVASGAHYPHRRSTKRPV